MVMQPKTLKLGRTEYKHDGRQHVRKARQIDQREARRHLKTGNAPEDLAEEKKLSNKKEKRKSDICTIICVLLALLIPLPDYGVERKVPYWVPREEHRD